MSETPTLADDSFTDPAIAACHLALWTRKDGAMTNAVQLLVRPGDVRSDESGAHPGERFVMLTITREEVAAMLCKLKQDLADCLRAAAAPRLDDFDQPIAYDTDEIDLIAHALTGDEGEDDGVTVLNGLVRYLGIVHPGKTMTQVLIETEEARAAAAPQAEPVPPATGAAQIIKLGAYGSAFDLPGDRRAYTYKHQPGNLVAWRIGDASSRVELGGDLIDRGLSALKALEAHGFGVFELAGNA